MKMDICINKTLLLFLNTACLLVILNGCGSVNTLTGCRGLSKADSAIYFVSGLMDHTELEQEWIVEEVQKPQIQNWYYQYHYKRWYSHQNNLDSIEVKRDVNRSVSYFMEEWEKIEPKISTGDKIYYYTTPEDYWWALAGQDGLVVVRDCEIVYVMILMQS